MILIKAQFTGKDGSLGYRTGREYLLIVEMRISSKEPIVVIPKDPAAQVCPYSNIETFLQNWDNIRRTKLNPA